MNTTQSKIPFWRLYFQKRMILILFFGFSSGLPLNIFFTTVPMWLSSYGISKQNIGMLSLAEIFYSLKFLWAPFFAIFTVPFFTRKMGNSRAWLLMTQILIFISFAGLSFLHIESEYFMLQLGFILVTLGFFSASQDILVDAYRIDSLPLVDIPAGGAIEVFGYRLGMLVSGALALLITSKFESMGIENAWAYTLKILTIFPLVGIITTFVASRLFIKRPQQQKSIHNITDVFRAYWVPLKDFIQRPYAWLILVFIFTFYLGESLIGKFANIFYKELGFTLEQIAQVSKLFGVGVVILSSMTVGVLVRRYGLGPVLLFSTLFHVASNAMFLVLNTYGAHIPLLYVSIILENSSTGIMVGAFVGLLSSLCNKQFSASQYALLTSFSSLPRKLVPTLGGTIAEQYGWDSLFIISILAALPAIFLLIIILRLPQFKWLYKTA